MAENKKYISKIVKGGKTLHVKDAEARQDIADIKSSITGAMHWLGYTTTGLTDGATTNPVEIDGKSVTAQAGDVVAIVGEEGKADLEFVFSGEKWQEYGSTGSIKALAFKDNASGSITPAGSNDSSAVTFEGQATGDFVTGYNDDAQAPSLGDATKSKFVTGYNADGVAPSLTDQTTSDFATEGETTTYDEESETLTFNDASVSSAVTDRGTFNAGSAATLATADAVTEQGTFDAGSAATLATASAVTAVGTGTAAGQTFHGTQDTVTVS